MTNDKNLTPELLEKAKSAPSAAVLLTLAQESGITLTAEQAATYYAQLHPETGAISDAELNTVTGSSYTFFDRNACPACGCTQYYTKEAYDVLWGPRSYKYCANCDRQVY